MGGARERLLLYHFAARDGRLDREPYLRGLTIPRLASRRRGLRLGRCRARRGAVETLRGEQVADRSDPAPLPRSTSSRAGPSWRRAALVAFAGEHPELRPRLDQLIGFPGDTGGTRSSAGRRPRLLRRSRGCFSTLVSLVLVSRRGAGSSPRSGLLSRRERRRLHIGSRTRRCFFSSSTGRRSEATLDAAMQEVTAAWRAGSARSAGLDAARAARTFATIALVLVVWASF